MSEERQQGVFVPGEHGHQSERDLDTRGLFKFVMWFVIIGLLLLVAMGLLFAWLLHRAEAGDAPPSPLLAERQPPPHPRVQREPPPELFEMRAEAARRLGEEGYGWIDREAGVVHIPIERAMELVAAGRRAAPVAPEHEPEHGGAAPAPRPDSARVRPGADLPGGSRDPQRP